MDKKFEGKIIASLRKLSFAYPPRNEAKKECKIDSCLYSCSLCSQLVYEGKSEKNYNAYVEEYGNVVWESFQMDHIEPVIKPSEGRKLCKNFGEYISIFVQGLFVPVEGWQGICKKCHKDKSKKENLQRKKNKTRVQRRKS